MKGKRVSTIFLVLTLVIFYLKTVESRGKGRKGGKSRGGGGGGGGRSTERTNTSQDSRSNNPSTGTTMGSTNTNATRSNTVAANAGFIIVGGVESHPNSAVHDKPFQSKDKNRQPAVHSRTSSWVSRLFSGAYNRLFGSKKMVEKKKTPAKEKSSLKSTKKDIDTVIETDDNLISANPKRE